MVPNLGSSAGGAIVTIHGSGFEDTCVLSAPPCGQTVLGVLFGNVQAPSFKVISDTEIEVVTPPHAPATVDVTVYHVLGQPVLRNSFTFVSGVPVLSPIALAILALAVVGFTLTRRF